MRSDWAGFRPGRECQPLQPPQRWRERKHCLNAPFPPPVAGAINSGYHLAGAQQPERSTPVTTWRVPSSRSDQLQPPDGCPTTGGPTSNPDRRTGPRTEDLNTPPVRPALPAESNLKSAAAAFPRGRPFRRATSNPSGHARATGIVPPRFLWRETSEKPDNEISITSPDSEKKGFGSPGAQSVQSSS